MFKDMDEETKELQKKKKRKESMKRYYLKLMADPKKKDEFRKKQKICLVNYSMRQKEKRLNDPILMKQYADECRRKYLEKVDKIGREAYNKMERERYHRRRKLKIKKE